MKDMEMNPLGDLVFNDQDILLIESEREITQSIKIIISTRLTEFFLDQEMGLSRDNLLGKYFSIDYLKQDISNAVLDQEERITSIEEIAIEKELNRHLKVRLFMKANGDEIETEVVLNA